MTKVLYDNSPVVEYLIYTLLVLAVGGKTFVLFFGVFPFTQQLVSTLRFVALFHAWLFNGNFRSFK